MLSKKKETTPLSERCLGVAGSTDGCGLQVGVHVDPQVWLSPRFGQWFMSNGIRHLDFVSIGSACYQSLSENLS